MYYTKVHEWVKIDGIATVGISDDAADELGDINLLVELRKLGKTVSSSRVLCAIESFAKVSQLTQLAPGWVLGQ